MKNEANRYTQNLNRPDERREFKGHGHLDVVDFDGVSIGRAEFEPGWKWVDDVKPLAGTETCEAAHAGYCLAGSMVVKMNDGTEIHVKAGDAYRIPPGHTAWVEGNEKCVMLDVGGYANYAKKQERAA
jgi:mannose-6-phosphate isomerase-like protein (cupin superfamily)